MSELITAAREARQFRRQLLTTVSMFTLLIGAGVSSEAAAQENDRDRPTVWVEVGGQLERNGGIGQSFVEPFMLFEPTPAPFETGSPIDIQRPSRYSKGGHVSVVFDPAGTNWSFSASLQYGRSNGNKHVFEQTDPHRSKYYGPGQRKPIVGPYAAPQFAETTVRQSESHTILDFQAGKDVGLGIFGHNGISTVAFGVRFAQFGSQADVRVRTRQNIQINKLLPDPFFFPSYKFHTYYLKANNERSFHGIGPSLSWKASAPVFGNPREGEFAIDWGLTGAVLFGRQKTKSHHQSTDSYFKGLKYIPPTGFGGTHYKRYPAVIGNPQRSHSVVVPNVGAFAGITYRIENFKVSAGYRADFFFGATDGGIDTRQTYDRSFHGPFASVSVGLGG